MTVEGSSVVGGGDPLTSTSEKLPSKTSTLEAPKESKKDRHMRCLQDLSKFLERTNEATVQDVLLLTRTTRETLETVDEDLQKFCARIDIDSFLLDKSEQQLIVLLNELKGKIAHREQVIAQLETDSDNTEIKRSTTLGNELKTLVDKLIAIGYNLPDDIERLVENEAYEVNKEIITNRIQHSKTIADMRITHVKLEYELIEKWEATRRKWRQLRHDQALDVYTKDITSDEYNHPTDRAQFMKRYREEQDQRRHNLVAVLEIPIIEIQGL